MELGNEKVKIIIVEREEKIGRIGLKLGEWLIKIEEILRKKIKIIEEKVVEWGIEGCEEVEDLDIEEIKNGEEKRIGIIVKEEIEKLEEVEIEDIGENGKEKRKEKKEEEKNKRNSGWSKWREDNWSICNGMISRKEKVIKKGMRWEKKEWKKE